MAPKRSKAQKKNDNQQGDDSYDWRWHDLYSPGVSFNRIVTRSQTAFNRIKNDESDLELFADPTRHQPPGRPHLMEAMKGKYGAIPRTIITRSTSQHLTESKELCDMLKEYKIFKPEEAGTAAAKEELPTEIK